MAARSQINIPRQKIVGRPGPYRSDKLPPMKLPAMQPNPKSSSKQGTAVADPSRPRIAAMNVYSPKLAMDQIRNGVRTMRVSGRPKIRICSDRLGALLVESGSGTPAPNMQSAATAPRIATKISAPRQPAYLLMTTPRGTPKTMALVNPAPTIANILPRLSDPPSVEASA